MTLSAQAKEICQQVSQPETKLGDLRKLAKEIKRNHDLAMELWSTGDLMSQLLAILIMDKKQLDQAVIDSLEFDILHHNDDERLQLMDWLLANQLSKDKRLVGLVESWEDHPSPLQRRLFWYHQARLRWMGKTDQTNTEALLHVIESDMAAERPEVQWAMNFTACQIGKWQPEHRERCIEIGEHIGLYRDEKVPSGCTPNFIPEFIAIEVAKMK